MLYGCCAEVLALKENLSPKALEQKLWFCHRMKRRFDPRGMRKAMEDRNQEARQSAEAFLQDVKSGTLDPKAENFNQGAAQSPTDM